MTVGTRIQQRGDTAANWASANPVLLAREKGLETDTLKEKVGDGTTAWNALPYQNATSGAATLNDRGTWATATAYAIGDAVKTGGIRYACKVAHTSSATFSTDAASKWVQLGIDSAGAVALPGDAAGVLTNDGTGALSWGAGGGGGSISGVDNGDGTVTLTASGGTTLTDNGNGTVTIA